VKFYKTCQGEEGTALTHWEKRLFENEAMTGTHTQNPIYSRITMALMEDTGWYRPNYAMAEELKWGRGLGCDFYLQSCKEWMDKRAKQGKSIHPYCNKESSLAKSINSYFFCTRFSELLYKRNCFCWSILFYFSAADASALLQRLWFLVLCLLPVLLLVLLLYRENCTGVFVYSSCLCCFGSATKTAVLLDIFYLISVVPVFALL
jgi:hypothetical protein